MTSHQLRNPRGRRTQRTAGILPRARAARLARTLPGTPQGLGGPHHRPRRPPPPLPAWLYSPIRAPYPAAAHSAAGWHARASQACQQAGFNPADPRETGRGAPAPPGVGGVIGTDASGAAVQATAQAQAAQLGDEALAELLTAWFRAGFLSGQRAARAAAADPQTS